MPATLPVGKAKKSGTVWSAASVGSCAPQVLRVIAGLLLEPSDMARLTASTGGGSAVARPNRTLDLLVERVPGDTVLAARLAGRLSRRTARVAYLLGRSPYEILALWSAQSATLSRQEIGAMLARLGCAGDAALEPLARRLCREVQLEALRALPDHALPAPAVAGSSGPGR